jgi:hypothetical protein
MRRLVVTVSQAGRKTELCYRLEPHADEQPLDCLERLRAAVFLTGVAVKSAKVIERDREWVASPDLLSMTNAPLGQRRRMNDLAVELGPMCWLRVLGSAVN